MRNSHIATFAIFSDKDPNISFQRQALDLCVVCFFVPVQFGGLHFLVGFGCMRVGVRVGVGFEIEVMVRVGVGVGARFVF